MTGDAYLPLIVIQGPTAVGKTGLALEVAETVNGEIIGADSRQIYRYMDIGTAKPTPEERARVPHHMIDIIEPDVHLSLARFVRMTTAAVEGIHSRGRIPLLTGGTGQYITAVVEGWSIPEVAPNPALRDELETYAAVHGAQLLHNRLKVMDPTAAAAIHPNNVRRVIRALEVCIEAGQPISELQRKQPPPYQILELGLTLERPVLYARADARIDQMMEAGFLDEVRWLLAQGYDRRLPSMSGLGYAQLTAHLLDDIDLQQAVRDTKIATHDFIRRQYTWFRGHDRGILWHNVEQHPAQMVIDQIIHWLKQQG